jgi:hypothetical protein
MESQQAEVKKITLLKLDRSSSLSDGNPFTPEPNARDKVNADSF